MNKPALFTINNLSVKFETGEQSTFGVKNASVTIPEKEITIIYGASGSGKSSLLNVISGLQAPTQGTILYQNTNIYSQSTNELAYYRAHELGIVYQTNYWVKSLTVLENVAMPLYFLGTPRATAHAQAKAALQKVEMQDYANKHPMLLSGGEQQRVAMARAIISDPPVIIADEPTGNLDSNNGDKIIDLLKLLHTQGGKTIVLVTHNMEYISIASHLLKIQDGTVAQISRADIPKTVNDMLADAQNRITSLIRKSS